MPVIGRVLAAMRDGVELDPGSSVGSSLDDASSHECARALYGVCGVWVVGTTLAANLSTIDFVCRLIDVIRSYRCRSTISAWRACCD